MKKLFFISVFSASFAFAGAVCAQVDAPSDPQALIKTATQLVLDEVRTRAIERNEIPRKMDIVNRDIPPHIDFRRTLAA